MSISIDSTINELEDIFTSDKAFEHVWARGTIDVKVEYNQSDERFIISNKMEGETEFVPVLRFVVTTIEDAKDELVIDLQEIADDNGEEWCYNNYLAFRDIRFDNYDNFDDLIIDAVNKHTMELIRIILTDDERVIKLSGNKIAFTPNGGF